jgi:hypothetical protein
MTETAHHRPTLVLGGPAMSLRSWQVLILLPATVTVPLNDGLMAGAAKDHR